uniref:ARF like GTPase 9 n=1 Tax=Salvator merianae TaxID=96440 RepID=A0A8D0BG96_SALMN
MAGSLRQIALVGTAVAVTGGVAYAVWRSYFSPRQGPSGPEQQLQQQDPLSRAQERAGLGCTAPPESQDKPPGKQILVLGLDGAGKTSVLHALATNKVKRSTAPTEGINAVCISTEEAKMEFLEIGGTESLRGYWKMYLPRVLLLIYVVDSADHKRLPVAKKLLHQLIQSNSTLPVMILANKQDLEGAFCITDIHDALALSEIGDERKMFLIGTHVAEDGFEISSSLKDTRELIAQLVSDTL